MEKIRGKIFTYDGSKTIRFQETQARNKELIDLAIKACNKLGGAAEIGDGFVIVDTKKYKVKPK